VDSDELLLDEGEVFTNKGEGIALDELLAAVSWLRFNIDTDTIKPGTLITFSTASGATKQIKYSGDFYVSRVEFFGGYASPVKYRIYVRSIKSHN
jgi:hypothetical protein